MQCKKCGSRRFDVGGPITIWRQQTIRITDEFGNYTVEADELGETIESHDWEEATCADCAAACAVDMLFGFDTPDTAQQG